MLLLSTGRLGSRSFLIVSLLLFLLLGFGGFGRRGLLLLAECRS
jgi:hypothetical protein